MVQFLMYLLVKANNSTVTDSSVFTLYLTGANGMINEGENQCFLSCTSGSHLTMGLSVSSFQSSSSAFGSVQPSYSPADLQACQGALRLNTAYVVLSGSTSGYVPVGKIGVWPIKHQYLQYLSIVSTYTGWDKKQRATTDHNFWQGWWISDF